MVTIDPLLTTQIQQGFTNSYANHVRYLHYSPRAKILVLCDASPLGFICWHVNCCCAGCIVVAADPCSCSAATAILSMPLLTMSTFLALAHCWQVWHAHQYSCHYFCLGINKVISFSPKDGIVDVHCIVIVAIATEPCCRCHILILLFVIAAVIMVLLFLPPLPPRSAPPPTSTAALACQHRLAVVYVIRRHNCCRCSTPGICHW